LGPAKDILEPCSKIKHLAFREREEMRFDFLPFFARILAMKHILSFLILAFSSLSALCASMPSPDFMTVTDNPVMRILEGDGLSIGEILSPDQSIDSKVANSALYATTSFKKIVDDIGEHLEKIRQGDPLSGVGMKYSHRLFDVGFLKSPLSRMVLVGAVLRMDRGFVDPDTCGEFRLFYRLSYRVSLNGEDVASRLPMAINLVFNAKNKQTEPNLTCQEVARRWQKPSGLGTDTASVAAHLRKSLFTDDLIAFANLKQVEVNLQSVRWPSAVKTSLGGHAEYLMKVYQWSPQDRSFHDVYLENQIDVARIAKDPDLKKKLSVWIRNPENLKTIDQGTAVLPQEFLAKQGISVSPGGARRIQNRPFLRTFSPQDFKDLDFSTLEKIKSVNALIRRLDDHTCTGCHQQKSIAGFHFIGKDPDQKYPLNSSLVAGSPHFLADLPRRREIVNSYLQNQTPDFSRGFAERTDAPASVAQLKGTGLIDGWGARCSLGKDPSYRNWTCAEGFECRPVYKSNLEDSLGVCFAKNKVEIGDYCETGTVQSKADGLYSRNDTQEGLVSQPLKDSSQRCFMNKGGFPGGVVWKWDCSQMPKEATCVLLPSKKSGFNDCLAKQKNFVSCIRDFSSPVGLRRCDDTTPCRDDFLCIQAEDSKEGACVPPYFLFQFRVDGHPLDRTTN
jgi:hypothetical protein